ncbi:transcriptional regulator GlxA family with amidase domain [Pseudonocardia endophytica]|uniref:Transcriptional regulator GlxA family with amidase domain n=1 Tax=Pseudonocardia endophytica TaxID=401976 RepID=A0A4R1I3F8_PSEEN|nr:transcriptional regulator GlxA family with amidase domain [Pseudonocardia endophytica]
MTSALNLANTVGADPPYDVTLATPGGAVVRSDSGLQLVAQSAIADVAAPVDTVVVSGGNGHEAAAADRHLIAHLRRLAGPARRVASVCTGATLLAAAGLLDGRRATTHWRYARTLSRAYPDVTVDSDPIFIRDGRVATSGGVTAALDLTLAFVEEDHGADLARRVALGLVTYMQRPGNQAQMTLFTTSRRADDATVRAAVEHAAAHPDDDLGTGAVARRAGVSTRQLTRLFVAELGEPPATVIRRIRLEAAAQLLRTTDLPLSTVAHRCGLTSAESLRQAFVARYGITPSRFRAAQARTP